MRFSCYFVIVVGLAVFLQSAIVHAGTFGICNGSNAGRLVYGDGQKKFKFCNGTAWVNASVATTGVSCSGIGNPEGTLKYRNSRYEFCDGTEWVHMQGTKGSTCTAAKEGLLEWNLGVFRFCDGSDYYALGDGAIEVDPCDGKTNGQACNGTTALFFTDGTSRYLVSPSNLSDSVVSGASIFSATSILSRSDGAGNTSAILTADATNAGLAQTAPYQCTNLNLGGIGSSGFYLPAADELTLLYSAAASLAMTTGATSYYWSSTQSTANTNLGVRVLFNTSTASDSPSAPQNAALFRCVKKL